METTSALSALARDGRLEVFRRLVRAGSDGMAAGEIARATGVLPNTLSSNLNILSAAGLVLSQRRGRSIIYTAAFHQMRDLLTPSWWRIVAAAGPRFAHRWRRPHRPAQ